MSLDISPKDIYHVVKIIPTLKWKGGLLGVRLLYQPKNIEDLFQIIGKHILQQETRKRLIAVLKILICFPKIYVNF